MRYVVITYYSDDTEQVQNCGDSKESAQVDYLLQRDAMLSGNHIERIQLAQVIQDSDIPQEEPGS
jgi:hypothetical protein